MATFSSVNFTDSTITTATTTTTTNYNNDNYNYDDDNGIVGSIIAYNDFYSQYDILELLNGGDEANNNNKKVQEYYTTVEVARGIQDYYLIVLATLGVPSNALTVATLLCTSKLSPATFFVVCLAVLDASALAVKLTGQMLHKHESQAQVWCCKVLDPLSIFCSTTANWVLVLICLERFFSVCYPLKRAYLFTRKRSFITTAVLIGSLFTLIMTSLGVMRTAKGRKCVIDGRFFWYFENVWLYLNVALHLFIPFILIIFLTAFIIYGLRKSRRHRMSLMRSKTYRYCGKPEAFQDDGAAGKKSRSQSTEAFQDGDTARKKPMSLSTKPFQDGSRTRKKSRSHSTDIFQDGDKTRKKSRSVSTPVTPTELRNQRMLDDTARLEKMITLMLIAAGLFFLVFSLPISLYYLLQGFNNHRDMNIYTARWMLYQQIAFVCVDTSHAINFFLYFFTAKRFRVQLRRAVTGKAACWERRQRRVGNSSNVPQIESGPYFKSAGSNSLSSPNTKFPSRTNNTLW